MYLFLVLKNCREIEHVVSPAVSMDLTSVMTGSFFQCSQKYLTQAFLPTVHLSVSHKGDPRKGPQKGFVMVCPKTVIYCTCIYHFMMVFLLSKMKSIHASNPAPQTKYPPCSSNRTIRVGVQFHLWINNQTYRPMAAHIPTYGGYYTRYYYGYTHIGVS